MNLAARLDIAVSSFASARFVSALTTVSIGAAALAFPIRQLMGWPALIGILASIVLLFAVVLFLRRGELEWVGLLPLSLLAFAGWAAVSLAWSQYQWVTLESLLYAFAFTVLAISAALLRDTLQLIRAFGGVLRFALALSLAVEVLSGLLIDLPLPFLGVQGNLAELGPIQGVFGTRNQLGLVSLIALVTFAMEWRTRTASRGLAFGSVVLGALCLALSQSPVAWGGAVVAGVATLALIGIRRVAQERRRIWNAAVIGGVGVSAILAWIFRGRIVAALDATSELQYRLGLWRELAGLRALHPLEGWGWVGSWRSGIVPFNAFWDLPGGIPDSAASAYADVWFQLGLVGLVLFLVLVGLALIRSWILATAKRSSVFVWPALILVVLVTNALAQSAVLIEFGWLTLVVCTVKASRELSWRQAFLDPPAPDLPSDPRTGVLEL